MRFFVLFIVILTVSCGGVSRSVSNEKTIIGSWKLMGMTKKPFPIDKITETDLMGGSLTFKPDKTFDGEIAYPKMPDKNLKVSGTYTVENEILTINNQTNNSTTQSTLKFEKDFMIATLLNPDGFIMYYKRLN
jgi:hypothetical protein